MKNILTLLSFSITSLLASAAEPQILDQVPPTDAGRGLIRVNAKDIRHYGGHVGQGGTLPYIISKDGGKTWQSKTAGDGFPKKWGGIAKEAAAIVYLPQNKKYMMIQPIGGHIFMSDDIDGAWYASAADGKAYIQAAEWQKDRSKLYNVPRSWIFRNPLELSNGSIIIPMHTASAGTRFIISKDGGKSWTTSKDAISVPAFQEEGIDLGGRWRNGGVECTVVELKNKQLYALVRTDSNMSYESYSKDGGNTWSKPAPSPFYGSLIMSTLGRLKNGKLICLWTNTAPLPELAHGKGTRWEDVFTARGALHVALSDDEGKSWYGYREVIIDPLRNTEDFATKGGDHDRSSHQSEFIELDENRLLVTSGQHPKHTKMIIIDQDWIAEKGRKTDFAKDGLEDITTHVFIPKIHRVQYNRKQGAEITTSPAGKAKAGVKFGILNDPDLTATNPAADYRRGGIAWNFPLSHAGEVSFSLKFPEGSNGFYVSLTDRQFNACDPSTPERAIFSLKLAPGEKLGKGTFKADTAYRVRLRFEGNECAVYINKGKKPATVLRAKNSPKVGISYLHLLAAEDDDVSKGTASEQGSKYYQIKVKGKTHEKSTVVGDLSMQQL